METKLHISQEVPSHFISRHHLLARLNAGLTCKLILICAPPGFGKSTLVGEWLRQLDHSVAWLSLDEGDNDPVTFMTYAVAALQRLDARLGQTLADLLEAPEMPAVEVLLTSLLNHIAAAAAPLIWVLDDYHVIANQDIHQTCRFLLDHCPPNLHLVQLYQAAAGQEAANRARQALETVPGDWRYVRSCAWIRLAGAYQMTGELNDCYAAMVNGRQEARRYPDTSYVYVLREHCALYWMAAELDHLLETATRLLDLGREFNLPETLGWAHYWLGSVYYQRNHLTEAERCFGAVVEHRHLAHVTCVTHSVFGLALTYQAQGLVQQASAAAQLTTECLMEQRNPALTRCVQTFQAELALIQGDLATAGRWLVTVGLHSPLTPQPDFYTSYLTLPKILLAQNTPASRQRALTALTRQCDFFQATHNQRCLIDTLVLLALLFYAEDDVQAAGRAVEQALVLGQAGGFVRAFLDAGERMTQLLGRLSAGRPRVQQFIGELLSLRAQHETVLPSAAPGPVPEPLSERELTVLRLLDSELSGPELAARLFISVNTLKTHLKRIYEKLGARSRYEAVVRAQELGLTKQ